MPNILYDKGAEKFLNGEISWGSDVIRPVLIDVADYTVDPENDEFLDDIPAEAIVAVGDPLVGKTTEAGVAGCDPFAFEGVDGDPCEAVVFFVDTEDSTTSSLIAYYDDAPGLPVSPNGSDINVLPGTGPNKLFKL